MRNVIDISKHDERAALKARLTEVRAELARMDEAEPEDIESEAYEIWAERHEELEDLADELLDRLDTLAARNE